MQLFYSRSRRKFFGDKKEYEVPEFLGAHLDTEKNELRGETREIGSQADLVKLLVIPTDEEMVIAEETARLCANVVML